MKPRTMRSETLLADLYVHICLALDPAFALGITCLNKLWAFAQQLSTHNAFRGRCHLPLVIPLKEPLASFFALSFFPFRDTA